MEITTPESNPELKILVYGSPGVGKTTFAGTAQDHEATKETLFLSAEGGTTSIRHRKLSLINIKNFDQFTEAHEFLHAHCMLRDKGDDDKLLELHNRFHETQASEPILYNTVVVDSLTEVQHYAMYDIMGVDYNVDLGAEIEQPEIRHWYKNSEKISRLVRSFFNLDINIIFTALKKEGKDEETGKLEKYPALSGQAAEKVPGVFDIVGYYFTQDNEEGEVERKMLTQPRNGYVAKDRTDELPVVMSNPTVPAIFDAVYTE